MADEVIITSTTDSPEQIEEALRHGVAPPADDVLSEEGEEQPPAPKDGEQAEGKEPPTEGKKPAGENEEKPVAEKKAPEVKKTPEEEELGRRSQKRIDKLVAEREDARRRADAAEAKLKALETGEQKPAEASKEAPAAVAAAANKDWLEKHPEPKQDDYDEYDKFSRAWTQWKTEQMEDSAMRKAREAADTAVKQALKERDEKDAAARESAVRLEQLKQFEESKKDARGRYDDFDEVMLSKEVQEMKLSGPMQHVIMDSAVGHDIAYWLAKHPDEAAELADLDGADALRELGRLERSIELTVASRDGKKAAAAGREGGASADDDAAEESGEKEPPKKAVATKAPAPIRPVGGRSVSTRIDLSDPNISQEEFKILRNKQDAARRSGRR